MNQDCVCRAAFGYGKLAYYIGNIATKIKAALVVIIFLNISKLYLVSTNLFQLSGENIKNWSSGINHV